MKSIKTVTSRYLRKEFSDRVNQFYSQRCAFERLYFIASYGCVTVEMLKKYVESRSKPLEFRRDINELREAVWKQLDKLTATHR